MRKVNIGYLLNMHNYQLIHNSLELVFAFRILTQFGPKLHNLCDVFFSPFLTNL